ncbi:TonB-dependent receptor [bacterium]|nr:TonB-dependent receptor [bacterium]
MFARILLTILLYSLAATFAAGAVLQGKVTDYSTGEPIAGVVITIKETGAKIRTDSDGHFRLENIPAGRYVVNAATRGYSTAVREVVLSEKDVITWNPELTPRSSGATDPTKQPRYLLPEVTVSTTRADRETPVSFSNLDEQDVETRYHTQDVPLLLSELPGMNAYSDAASGVGYSYLKLRGFSQNRVAVMLNNVPLNDAESHEVFWIDLPDFPSDVQDIQVQRGVGSSLYGAAALGGSINLITKVPGSGDAPGIRLVGGYGSFNTRKASLSMTSGRIAGRYGFAGRLTRIHSDGYRFGSWTDLWSYHLSAARYTEHHTTHVNFYGGPERTHLAYNGIPKEAVDGLITGDKNHDRRMNSLTYENEVDNFFQPHYELHDEWKLTDKLDFNNTIYLFRGDGYYDQWRPGKKLEEYFFEPGQGTVQVDSDTLFDASYYVDENDDGIPDADTLADGHVVYHLERFDLLRRRNIGETDWGWIPRLSLDYGKGEAVIGGEIRLHDARHEGLVRWGNLLPVGVNPDYHYYDYRVKKQSLAGFLHLFHSLTSRLRVMVDLQVQSQSYQMDDDKLFGVEMEKTFDAFTPRFGVNYLLLSPDKRRNIPAASVYANFSMAQREPAFADIYDPQDYWSSPLAVPARFEPRAGGYKYIGESLKPEKLSDIEVGTSWEWSRVGVGVNAYYMSLRDEIVPYAGQLDDNGVPISGNAEKTLHQGLEFVMAASPTENIKVSGNLVITDHHFVSYNEWDWNAWDFINRDGNQLAGDPTYIGNMRVEWKPKNFMLALSLRTVGKQYIDNSQNEGTAVSSYEVLNFDAGYRFEKVSGLRGMEVRLRVNNVLNSEYETSGYSDYDDGTPRYFVAPPTNIITTLIIDV